MFEEYRIQITVRAVQQYVVTASSEAQAHCIAAQLAERDGYRGFDVVSFNADTIASSPRPCPADEIK